MNTLESAIGNTPLAKLQRMADRDIGDIYLKLEENNCNCSNLWQRKYINIISIIIAITIPTVVGCCAVHKIKQRLYV